MTLREVRHVAPTDRATLLLGYAQLAEPAIPAAIRELADAVRAARA